MNIFRVTISLPTYGTNARKQRPEDGNMQLKSTNFSWAHIVEKPRVGCWRMTKIMRRINSYWLLTTMCSTLWGRGLHVLIHSTLTIWKLIGSVIEALQSGTDFLFLSPLFLVLSCPTPTAILGLVVGKGKKERENERERGTRRNRSGF